MKIEENQKELDAMAEFHKGNRAEEKNLQQNFVRNTKIKITVLA